MNESETRAELINPNLKDAGLGTVDTLLPSAWNTSEVGEIRDYLTQIVAHRDEFADQLTQSLL